jgi:hypothetical protein
MHDAAANQTVVCRADLVPIGTLKVPMARVSQCQQNATVDAHSAIDIELFGPSLE